MARPTNQQELIEKSEENFEKLMALVERQEDK